MAHTFDIRFARSGGIAALFDAAENSFGWKGGGLLSIDAQGMSFALKRNIVSLLARRRSQRIPAEKIKEIYREGDALRVEFATEENPRAVLPFWARDRDTAAQIVQLLPTSRTFELEHSTNEPDKRDGKRMLLVLGAAVLLAGVALFIGFRRAPAPNAETPASVASMENDVPVIAAPEIPGLTQNAAAASASSQTAGVQPPASLVGEPITPEQARRLAIMAEDPVDWTVSPTGSSTTSAEAAARTARMARLSPPAESEAEPQAEGFVPIPLPEIRPRADDQVVPVTQTTLAHASARELLRVFEAEAADLSESYQRERERVAKGDLNALTFADRLDWYELRWRNLIERVLQDKKFSDPVLTGLRATLLSVVISQRAFFSGYAAGLRTGDQAGIDRAFEELARAEERLVRARQFVN
jgi:hypothetical protein